MRKVETILFVLVPILFVAFLVIQIAPETQEQPLVEPAPTKLHHCYFSFADVCYQIHSYEYYTCSIQPLNCSLDKRVEVLK